METNKMTDKTLCGDHDPQTPAVKEHHRQYLGMNWRNLGARGSSLLSIWNNHRQWLSKPILH